MNIIEPQHQDDKKTGTLTLSKVQADRLNRYMQSTDTTDLIMNYYSKQYYNKTCNWFRAKFGQNRRMAINADTKRAEHSTYRYVKERTR